MEYIIGFAVGVIATSITWFFVARHNKKIARKVLNSKVSY